MGNNTVRRILLAVAGAVFLCSSAVVLHHRLEMHTSAKQSDAVVQAVVTPVRETPDAGDPVPSVDPASSEEALPPPPPIQVDFDALCAQNEDVVAWIYCPDTPINYPVVQSSDNAYYLHRLLDGRKNAAGTLFMDYRNAEDLSDWNSVIYGHNMNNDSMFGSLQDYRDQAYADAHPEIFLLTPEKNYTITVLAGFVTPSDTALYNALSPDEEEQSRLIEGWLESSDFSSGIEPAPEDRFVTLSTCSYAYSDARYVLVGVLNELRSS